MTPTAAARASHASHPSLRDRLKDASLLREQCYIDGAWTGTPANPVTNPVHGLELAQVPKMSTAEAFITAARTFLVAPATRMVTPLAVSAASIRNPIPPPK